MKNPEQVVSKDWEKAIWELNRILAAHRRDIDSAQGVGGGSVTNVVNNTTQVTEESDETLHWVF